MPIYEYHCKKCGKDREVIQKFSDKPLKKCPDCGGKLEKKLSLSGFQLKGSGWYKDGYASQKPDQKTDQKTEKTPEKKSDSKPDTSSGPRPDSKTTSKPRDSSPKKTEAS